VRDAGIGIPVLGSDELLCVFDEGLDNPVEENDRTEGATSFALDVVPDEARAVGWLVGEVWLVFDCVVR
jgi:hypothetical protein